MASPLLEARWIWHPKWSETARDTAGAFVHFRRSIFLPEQPRGPVKIQITADTKYKLFVNSRLVSIGPVKGDQHLWFYDDVDIASYLRLGRNYLAIRVLRLYYATSFATSFPRLPSPGLLIRHVVPDLDLSINIQTGDGWETALDASCRLPVDIKEDDFLHIYEAVNWQEDFSLTWVPAKVLEFPASHGITPPWKLSPRMIPGPRLIPGHFKALHNVRSPSSLAELEQTLLAPSKSNGAGVLLKAGTSHHIEIEAEHHATALLAFRFKRPSSGGSTMSITYSECYEDEPFSTPYLRNKGDRLDSSKLLTGPQDLYTFGGRAKAETAKDLWYDLKAYEEETFVPFHFRTLRFITLDIQVANNSDLVLQGVDITLDNYPLDVRASFDMSNVDGDETLYQQIWSTSIRTLSNCLHDCVEDCPFYEQLQYAMDTRSSILFMYAISHDDRLVRQAIRQLHNSYLPSIGLTASRAPAHQLQIIPHFSLYWICMVYDHFEYYCDMAFVRQFIHTCDGVLETFARDVDPEVGLVRHDPASPHWFFVDWTDSWRPMGIPPAGARTGYLSYTSMLYAYALRAAAKLARGIGRSGLAEEYDMRARSVVDAVTKHCFDGELFTDGLASQADPGHDYSQQTQIWAVLSGAATDELAATVLRQSFALGAVKGTEAAPAPSSTSVLFSPASTAMSFYALRALSTAGFSLYNSQFHHFWKPWREQLARRLSTWEEDTVSQRSDCHAWGCAALYEFSAEVAGIRPGAPGWATISFRPRVALFRQFKGRVPFGGGSACARGMATVEWRAESRGPENVVRLSLRLELDLGQEDKPRGLPPVEMVLPDGTVETVQGAGLVERIFLLM